MFIGTPKELTAVLESLDHQRAKLREEYERAMAKLDADERFLLGLEPERPAPHVGQPCPKAPDGGVHQFRFAGLITEPWAELAQCRWCGITPNGERKPLSNSEET